jgi:TPR repeat protein
MLLLAMTTQLGDLTEKALGGDLDSIAIIADSFIKRKDYKNAFKFYTISATRNHAHSQRKLGDMHNFSLGIPTDHKTAMMWYKKAYDNGCNTSGSIIAALYFRGYGVPMDKSKTMEWLLKAGNAGSFAAQYNIGFMYQMGLCTEKNIQLAIHFYQKSADKGSEQAKTKLKELNEKGYYLINIGKGKKSHLGYINIFCSLYKLYIKS